MTNKPEPMLFLDEHRGVYIPRDFANCVIRENVLGVRPDDWAILEAGPDQDYYWDAWDDVCWAATLTDPSTGRVYTLYQDGCLWLIPEGMEWSEEEGGYAWPSEAEEEAES